MKIVFIILISIVIANLATAQTTANEAIEGCVFGAMGNEKFEKFGYINSHGEKTTCSFDDIAALLQKDVIGFYGLGDKYNTELKVKAYKQTDDYKDTYETMMEEYDYFTQNKGYVLFNLRYNSNYDVAKRCFFFKIGFDDLYRYSQPNYLCFEKGLALTYPSAYLSRTKQEISLATNGTFNYNILKTTTISEETALKIENEMEKPNCNARLLIIFKLSKAANEKKVVAGYYVDQTFIIGKSIAAYLVNVKTGEVYANMSSIFNQTANRKTTIQ